MRIFHSFRSIMCYFSVHLFFWAVFSQNTDKYKSAFYLNLFQIKTPHTRRGRVYTGCTWLVGDSTGANTFPTVTILPHSCDLYLCRSKRVPVHEELIYALITLLIVYFFGGLGGVRRLRKYTYCKCIFNGVLSSLTLF